MRSFARRWGVCGLLAAAATVGAAEPEMRAMWVSRFEWAPGSGTTPDQTRARIDTIMSTLRANNFNAVLFQIRGQCDVLYPSPYEPWGRPFNWTDPGWDPLAYAIESAHSNGLEFHAYINTHTMIQDLPPTTTAPQHLYNVHGPSSSEPWVIHNEAGEPQNTIDAYVWISPGIPAAEAWTRRSVMHVVENYDVDGVHFDRIRTPGPSYSYDPTTVARFNGPGNPNGLEWGDFMRSQITEQLRRIQGQIALVKPHVKTSAAPFGICRKEPDGYQGTGTESYFQWYQDSFGWMEEHVLDCLFPQIYWEIGSAHPYEVLLADFRRYDGGRHIYPGSTSSRDYIAQVYEARRQGALGTTVFSFNSVNMGSYLAGPYAEPAPVPDMPWKSAPTTAVVAGLVKGSDGSGLVDAIVTIEGDSFQYTSGGDGWFSILDVPPGTHTVTATYPGLGARARSVTVAAGDALRLDMIFTDSMGTLSLDKTTYLAGETVVATVQDGDLETSGSVSIRIATAREPLGEAVTLSATSPGVFSGGLPIEFGPPVADDGTLQAGAGVGVTARYDDAFDGNGPAAVTAQASVAAAIVDNDAPGFTSTPAWLLSSFGANYGTNKRYIGNNNSGELATWRFEGNGPGRYELDFWVNNQNYASSAAYNVNGVGVTASQNFAGDGWHDLTTLDADGDFSVTLPGAWNGTGTFVVADALRLTWIGEAVEPVRPDLWILH